MGFMKLAGVLAIAALATAVPTEPRSASPKSFLRDLGNSTWIIGNDIWNMTQGRQYGVKLMYKGKDRVGRAVGHYVSYSMLFNLPTVKRRRLILAQTARHQT